MSDFPQLRALYINTTLRKAPEESHTRLLMLASAGILESAGVTVEHVHMLSHQVPPGVYPDMTEHGWERDDWPALWAKVERAHILVIGTPIWLGEESSVCRVLIERLYAMSGQLNDRGQSVFYGRVGGTIVTGNEDGVKHVAMTTGFALNHLGYSLPPQADCGWIGEAGPGPSFGDDTDGGRAGLDNDFTRNNTTIMTWNLLHLARMLAASGGYPSEGNDRNALAAGEGFGFAYPEGGL